jgi:hypothetical protein
LGGAATVSLGSDVTVGASATGTYFFTIQGPSSVTVPLIITGTTETRDNGTSNLAASIILLIPVSGDVSAGSVNYFSSAYGCAVVDQQNPGATCNLSGSQFAIDASALSDSINALKFIAAASLGFNAFATVDPIVSIDPSFAGANEFTLVANPGVLPSPPPNSEAPEPSSLSLLAIGFWSIVQLMNKQLTQHRTLRNAGSRNSPIRFRASGKRERITFL